jgi:hypothetical protein
MVHRALFACAWSALAPAAASAFCGFYVARADTKLYNEASQVALVRAAATAPCSRWPTTTRASRPSSRW